MLELSRVSSRHFATGAWGSQHFGYKWLTRNEYKERPPERDSRRCVTTLLPTDYYKLSFFSWLSPIVSVCYIYFSLLLSSPLGL